MAQVVQLQTSRRFLIGQAVLNAADKHFPWGVKNLGVATVLRKIEAVPGYQPLFAAEVCRQYAILSGTYAEEPEEFDDFCFTDPDFINAINGAFHT